MHHPPGPTTSARAEYGVSLQLHAISDCHGEEENDQCLLKEQAACHDVEAEFCCLRFVAEREETSSDLHNEGSVLG